MFLSRTKPIGDERENYDPVRVIRGRRSKSEFGSAFGNSGANFKKDFRRCGVEVSERLHVDYINKIGVIFLIEDPKRCLKSD
jgi:hypothetical protein